MRTRKKNKLLQIVMLGIVLLSGIRINAMIINNQQSPIIDTFELVKDFEVSLDKDFNSTETEKKFVIPYFRDITYIEMIYEANYQSLDRVELEITVNDMLTKIDFVQSLDQERLTVIIDSNAILGIKYPTNEFSMKFTASFVNRILLKDFGYFTLKILSITLHTLYQNDPIQPSQAIDVRKEAIIIPESYYTKVGILNIYSKSMYFNLVLPRDINQSYIFNLTIRTNVEVEYRRIFMENFGIHGQRKENMTYNVEFEYIGRNALSITKLRIDLFPVVRKDFYIELNGFFRLGEKRDPFPTTEFDFILFFIVTAVIPPLFVGKLFYKRLRNIS